MGIGQSFRGFGAQKLNVKAIYRVLNDYQIFLYSLVVQPLMMSAVERRGELRGMGMGYSVVLWLYRCFGASVNDVCNIVAIFDPHYTPSSAKSLSTKWEQDPSLLCIDILTSLIIMDDL